MTFVPPSAAPEAFITWALSPESFASLRALSLLTARGSDETRTLAESVKRLLEHQRPTKSAAQDVWRELRKELQVNRTEVFDTITVNDDGWFPWESVQGPATQIAFLYNFAPFQDTGSTVASKRLRRFGRTTDVVACSMLQHKKLDTTVEAISRPYVRQKAFLPHAPSWANWDSYVGYAARGLLLAEHWGRQGARYETCYSRAMWAPSIYAGALYKIRNPHVQWIAEFSDPLSLDVQGALRGQPIPDDDLRQEFIDAIQKAVGITVGAARLGIFSLAETLAYAIADELVFTNDSQRSVMLDHIEDDSLRRRASQVSTISNHPTLPPTYYTASPPFIDNFDPAKINLGYFGEFYSTRGINEVTDAIRGLPGSERQKVHLHVFTNYAPGIKSEGLGNFSAQRREELEQSALLGVGVDGVEENVTFHSSLPYLEFLGVTNLFDVLIVSDAESGSGHSVNPYLPSKWSDYAGSLKPVWGLIESDSELARKKPHYVSARGDSSDSAKTLRRIVENESSGVGDD